MPRGRPKSGSTHSLESRIQAQAAQFAREIIAALRSAPLSDIAALSASRSAPVFATAALIVPSPATGTTPTGRPKRRMVNYPK